MKEVCRRCGLNHLDLKCSAWNSRCYKCGKAGHYARQCFENCKYSHSFLYERKKKRDSERMTAFIRKKNLQNLPFFGVETQEVISFFPKNDCANTAFIAMIKIQQQKHEDKTSILTKENNKLQNLVEELHNKALNEQKRYLAIENSKHETVYLLTKKEEELQNSKELCLELERKLETSKESFQQKITKSEDVNISLNKLINYFYQAEEEFKEVMDEIYEQINEKPSKPVKEFDCRRCGSIVFHKYSTCFARHNECSICGKQNHFTSMCEQRVHLEMIDVCESED